MRPTYLSSAIVTVETIIFGQYIKLSLQLFTSTGQVKQIIILLELLQIEFSKFYDLLLVQKALYQFL